MNSFFSSADIFVQWGPMERRASSSQSNLLSTASHTIFLRVSAFAGSFSTGSLRMERISSVVPFTCWVGSPARAETAKVKAMEKRINPENKGRGIFFFEWCDPSEIRPWSSVFIAPKLIIKLSSPWLPKSGREDHRSRSQTYFFPLSWYKSMVRRKEKTLKSKTYLRKKFTKIAWTSCSSVRITANLDFQLSPPKDDYALPITLPDRLQPPLTWIVILDFYR